MSNNKIDYLHILHNMDAIIKQDEQNHYDKQLKLDDLEVTNLVNQYKTYYLQYGQDKDQNHVTLESMHDMYEFFKVLVNDDRLIFKTFNTWYEWFYHYNYLIYCYFYEQNPSIPWNEFDKKLGYSNEIKRETKEIYSSTNIVFKYTDPRIMYLLKEFITIVPEAKRD